MKKGRRQMLVGVDTGFFYELQESNRIAIDVWKDREAVTSCVVLYEIQKKVLQGDFKGWSTLIEDIERAMYVVPLNSEIAKNAGHLARGTGMPGLDALILASLIEAGCCEIYTKNPHFKMYEKKGIKIIDLSEESL